MLTEEDILDNHKLVIPFGGISINDEKMDVGWKPILHKCSHKQRFVC